MGTKYKPEYFSNTRELIPRMLEMFVAHKVEVTWATVGMLFAENEEEWKEYSPEFQPSYRDRELSAYHWVKQYGIKPEVHFAPELVKMILDTPGQELGSHSYAHYYTLVRGQSPEQFRQDLQATQEIAKEKFGLSLESLVFPRNHINELYLKVCLEEGYQQVRGNPKNWYWQETQHESFSKKLFRSADCFFPVGAKTSYGYDEMVQYPNEPLIIPASRIFRPYSLKNGWMNSQRLKRVKDEMAFAAENGEVYHLWWHPHNFGSAPQECLKELQEILDYYDLLRENFGMQSLHMASLGQMMKEKVI
ncbi:polysaccharide deacetylase family protein [Algoriphagus sediminis]|uniref:Polysaccharide deacetylase family protein n=1 Tax=Algoriphagus sediminis TaxID=3057113 RepID=A0ABT7YDT5_9BACT|nr:polysaccharide deacetylase family protein [Algoriphagus sediminis]MDN3204684.1 polysaccharide deacetylase family protein [Algoriphagus sediminis]